MTDDKNAQAPAAMPAPPARLHVRLMKWVWKNRFASVSAVVGGWLLIEFLTLPFGDVLRLKTVNPRETAFMRLHAEQARERQQRFRKSQHWVPLRDVPRHVVNAVIVAEDGTFWRHEGFDWYEFKESVERNLSEGRPARGASTITQQLVKNLYLSASKSPLRKLKEWVLTWWMEQNLSKARILEIYLNVIEWGPGVYGVEAAAQYHFGISCSELSREQAARLAAVIPRPRRYRASSDAAYVVRFSHIILQRMEARGW